MQQRQEAGSQSWDLERRETNLASKAPKEGSLVNPHSATTSPQGSTPMGFSWCRSEWGIYPRWGQGTTLEASGAHCSVTTSPAPTYNIKKGKLPSPHFFLNHLLRSSLKSFKGVTSLSFGNPFVWQRIGHFCVVGSNSSTSLTEGMRT